MNTEWDEQAEHDRDLEWESRMDLERTEATCDWVDHFSQFIETVAQVGEISGSDVCARPAKLQERSMVPAEPESNFGSESEPYTHEEAEARRREQYESQD